MHTPGDKEIGEGNRLIADFMNYLGGPKHEYRYAMVHAYENGNLKYHSDWSWLKNVVDEIFKYSLAYRDQTERLRKTSIVVDIIPCWQICVEFITWYNQQPPTA